MPDREGTWRGEGWDGQYVGRGAVTGTPVFTDPSMLAPIAEPARGPAPDLGALDVPSVGAAEPRVRTAPTDEVGAGDRRGRVRIYDQP